MRLHLLVVDADPAVRSACAEIAASLGYAVECTGDLGQARSLLRGHASDILLVNLPHGTHHGLELISEVKPLHPETSVIAMTASGSVNAAVEAMRCGASDYLTKPFAMDELSSVLDRAAADPFHRDRHPPVARAAAPLAGPGRDDRPLSRRWRSSTASCPRWRRAPTRC